MDMAWRDWLPSDGKQPPIGLRTSRRASGGDEGVAGNRRRRVLVVEDDETVAEVLLSYLRRAGLAAAHVVDGSQAVALVAADPPDLLLLDLMLPGMDGLEVCRWVRRRSPELPVVMLTARGEISDRIAGLEVGADDYVLKPFSPRELVLRIESVLRRTAAGVTGPEELRDDDLLIDRSAHRASLDGVELTLTHREFDLLSFLVANAGRVYSRDQLLSQVWGWEFGDLSTVTVHVRRLRAKIEIDPATPRRLVTVWGFGYRWEAT
jgi:DNA-binding response OmpR family regulator